MAYNTTSSDATLYLVAEGLFDNPQQIYDFSEDDAFNFGAATVGQTMMGVDGRLSGAYVPSKKTQSIILMASSPSIVFFESILAYQESTKTRFRFQGTASVPSLERTYVMTNGFLITMPPGPSAKRVLQPLTFTFEWESVVAAPF